MGKELQVFSYKEELWDTVRDMIVNRPDVSLVDISRVTDIPIREIEITATNKGWLSKRDLTSIKATQASLNRIMTDISYQLNETNEYVAAFIEAIQYSHRIKILKNPDGSLHFRNFEDFPDRPKDWDTLSEEVKEAYMKYINPSRLTKFWMDLNSALNVRTGVLNFIAKVSKGSLPKVNPTVIDVSRTGTGTVLEDPVPIFQDKVEKDDKADINDLINKIREKGASNATTP